MGLGHPWCLEPGQSQGVPRGPGCSHVTPAWPSFFSNISPHGLNTESESHAKCFTRLLSFLNTALSMREGGDRSSEQFTDLFQVTHFLYHGTRPPYIQRSFKRLSSWPSGTMTHQNGWIRAIVMEEGVGDPLLLEHGGGVEGLPGGRVRLGRVVREGA